MRWKRVVWAGWLAPALGGCHTPGAPGVPELPSGGLVAHTQAAIEHRIRADAREAWKAVRAEYPRRCFTAEFHDGFLDGYADHLDRGGDGTPPPTPPLRYTRHARYFTPEGHVLLKDYFLGFKYGADVAVATGQRQFLTVPVLVPDGGSAALADVVTPAAPPTPPSDRAAPLPQPLPPPNAVPKSDQPAAPPGPSLSKFPESVAPAALPVSLPVPRLPEPPAAVPTLPAHVPTPPVTDDLPLFRPDHDAPMPMPVVHPDPTR
ncbi:hypothetical protein [Urbifossiella limnaea]|uniref:Uncharacterized protein n=1 Tax=Urbifossiella limnaea TaxID=2528023 RepID=A0A517XPG6_9BACT|nr:hypothetical protein [Urbifossiella limnaea]QDU19386.1 hypothetical protein ETAA1_13100 [Urbifossiella limnaea]